MSEAEQSSDHHPIFREHPDRKAAIGEAHARPPLPVGVPCTIYYLAFVCREDSTADALFEAVFNEHQSEGSARHTIRELGGLTAKWELHTEFISITVLSRDGEASAMRLWTRVAAKSPPDAQLLIAIRLRVLPEGVPTAGYPIGGRLRSGMTIASDFRSDGDGFIDYDIVAPPGGADQLGRRVQRVLEVEVYRMMALLGLPEARRMAPEVARLENELADVVDALTQGSDDDETILERLQRLSARAEALRTKTRFRFSATQAYAALVDERLESLAEEKLGERPTLTGFVQTRLAPGVRTVVSLEARQAELSAAVARALNLLRARVDVSQNRANQSILESMNDRQHRQLRLSEAVESLSVIAITYYLIGVLGYPVKALIDMGYLPGTPTLVLGILAPFVALGVWWSLRRIRGRFTE